MAKFGLDVIDNDLYVNRDKMVIYLLSATALLSILPCIIFFLLFQRTLTRGLRREA